MPFVRADLPGNRFADRTQLGLCIQEVMHATLGVPMEECFQVLVTHAAGLVINAHYLGVKRSEDAVVVQIFLNGGRDDDTKSRFYAGLADSLHERIGLRREDLVINLVEVARSDWSFGNGQAQLVSNGGY